MGNTTKKSITRNPDRPARRARRSAEPVVETPMSETSPAPSPVDVAQLAFRFFADSGYVHGHALDHWLRAEAELGRQS
jgi:hypothetical protein